MKIELENGTVLTRGVGAALAGLPVRSYTLYEEDVIRLMETPEFLQVMLLRFRPSRAQENNK